MTYAVVFPGQGAQEVGMGKTLYNNFDAAKSVFDCADEALGFKLSDIIFEGPESELQKTAYTQPAILTMSIAVLRTLTINMGLKITPDYMAGHSLGEYTALVASGALSLEEGVRLVHLRGELMQEAVPLGEGTMAAVLGLPSEEVISLCNEASGSKVCQAANFNSPGQTVISGHREAVEKALTIAKQRGAKRAVMLKVSAPFHSQLLKPVAPKLREAAGKCALSRPACPIVANFSAKAVLDREEIIHALAEQTYMPVLWSDSIFYMRENGIKSFLEIGPGKVLSGLIKKTIKGSRVLSVSDTESLDSVSDFLKESDQL